MHSSWQPFLKSEFEKPYFVSLSDFLHNAYQNKQIFPEKAQVFRAFDTDLNSIKVVILGQDPYHTPGAAHGLAFSVPDDQPIPPSLRNIFKEIKDDFNNLEPAIKNVVKNTTPTTHQTGDLTAWASQGVLLLNNTLTVEAHRAGSHRNKGWEIFTRATVEYLNENCSHLVFILWGRDAKSKKSLIDQKKHLVLESPHPSPLSAHTGFFGNHHFSRTNAFLAQHNLPEINW